MTPPTPPSGLTRPTDATQPTDTNRDGTAPAILAHRGFSPDGAENTIAAFRAAWELGCRWLEMDVNTTRDGVVMVFHDATLDRVTDGSGAIGEHTHAELRELTVAGDQAMPTFEQLLAALPEARFNVDVKDAASAESLPALLERTGDAHRVRVASFSDDRRHRTLEELRDRGLRPAGTSAGRLGAGLFVVCMLTVPALWPAAARVVRRRVPPFDVVQVPWRLGWLSPRIRRVPLVGGRLHGLHPVRPRLVRAAHRAGVQVQVWTVDDPADLRTLIDLGVDGIVTNRADLGLRLVRRGRRRAR